MRKFDWRFTATISLLVATAAISATAELRRPESLARPLETIPEQIGQWRQESELNLGAEILSVLRPTSYLSRVYRGKSREAGLLIVYYARQEAGTTLHSPRHCLPGSGWEIWRQASISVPAPSGPVRINRTSIRNQGEKLVMYYWYQSKSRIVMSEIAGKYFLVHDSLLRGNTAGSLVRLTLADAPASMSRQSSSRRF